MASSASASPSPGSGPGPGLGRFRVRSPRASVEKSQSHELSPTHLVSPAPPVLAYSPSWSSNAPTPTSSKPMLPGGGGWARVEPAALPSAGMVLGKQGSKERGRPEPLSLVEGVQRDAGRRMGVQGPTRPARRRHTSHPGCPLCSKYAQALEDAANADDSVLHSGETTIASGSTPRPTPPHSADITSPSQPFLSTSSPVRFTPHTASSPSLMPESSGYGDPFSPAGSSAESERYGIAGAGGASGDDSVLYTDEEFMVYRAEGSAAACKDGRHLVVVPARHVESVYDFSPPDVPLLNRILDVSRRLLRRSTTDRKGKGKATDEDDRPKDVRIGFIVSPFKDSAHPYAHLHLHALVPPLDNASFVRRNFAFGGLWTPGSVGWWELEDLIAEIREESSNNRIKSGYGEARKDAPITRAPGAGSVSGDPNALERPGLPPAAYPASVRNEAREISLLMKRRDDFLREEAEEGGGPRTDLEAGGYRDEAAGKRSDSFSLKPMAGAEQQEGPAPGGAPNLERRQSTVALLPGQRSPPELTGPV